MKLLALVVFINRYIAGILLRILRGKKWDETRDDFEPSVTVVIPMFNEGEAIKETLQSLLASDYPRDKFEIVVVDDCSSDNSYELAREMARGTNGQLRVIRNRHNLGKRRSINRAVAASQAEIIVSVDSDVVVDPDAIRQLTRRFVDDRIAAVGGWVDVRNKHVNWLTRMQTIKYWYGYFFLKNLEWGFRRVMCLSGCLTAYRRKVLVELEPILEDRSILGVSIKYGEDRFLTRQIIKAGYLTTMTHAARCRTFVPERLPEYFAQQLRWRRSNIVDYSGAVSHVWKLNPFLAIHFFAQFALLVAYPITVIRALSSGWFFAALQVHLYVVAVFGLYYRWRVRKEPAEERVGSLAFMPVALLMPITYALMTPLALFTLDSGSWETRGHEPEPQPEGADTVPESITSTGQHVLVPALATESVRARAASRTTGSHAELPAA
ncbi:MAG TPA: glycosyltransferase [Kofleriaceae bacterium]|nr:glycosyltransferase [Kofleriaceae bacterium]